MESCTICKKTTEARLIASYKADLLGAPFDVFLINAVKEAHCSACDKITRTTIPNLEGLLHTVAATRAVISRKLSGAEIKFMRHAMSWKAKEVAEKLDMTAENYSRVENDIKPLGSSSEKMFRAHVIYKSVEKGEMKAEWADEIQKVLNLKIESFWDPKEELALHFQRVCPPETECGEDDGGKWVKPSDQIAA